MLATTNADEADGICLLLFSSFSIAVSLLGMDDNWDATSSSNNYGII